MFKISLHHYKSLRIPLNHIQLQNIQASCLCGNYVNTYKYNLRTRVHSTRSDRQKAVIETSNVIDKISLDKRALELWRVKIDPYIKLARWDKPIGVYLLFRPCSWSIALGSLPETVSLSTSLQTAALFLALIPWVHLLFWPCSWSIALGSLPGTVPLSTSLQTAALFLVGAGLMRGAGCTINDLWDRDLDAQVERTKDRPLVTGALTTKQAVGFLAVQLSLALGVLLQLNCYSVVLGASSMLLVVTYPLAKRFTNYPQIVLGATFNWGALLGYSAIQGTIEPSICIPLYFGALAWTVLYDTIYAHQDKADDLRTGIKSTALTFGSQNKSALCAALGLSGAALAAAGAAAHLAWPHAAALALAAAHAGTQIYTLDPDNPNDCANKFKSNSMIGLIILLGILGGGYTQYRDNREKHRGKEDLSVARSCLFG